MTIFRQAVNIPTVASSIANIGSYNALIPPVPGASIKLTLNGPIVGITGQVSFISEGYASGLSFSSALNVSISTFTIIGTYNGLIIQESLVGPNNSTVYTNNLFHTILSISATGAGVANAFTIGSNYNVAIVLPSGNSNTGLTHPNYTYSVLLNSRTAGGNWAANNAMIYGITGSIPSQLQNNILTNIPSDNRYYALYGQNIITQATLNSGIIVQSTYPFVAMMVYLASGINTTPVYIEITQS
jgi:hypothetical protein